MATADKLNKLLETKAAIRQAIINKGVDVADDTVFADYPDKISAIEGEGGGSNDDYIALRTNNHTNYSYLFYHYEGDSLEAFGLESWDTSDVTDMRWMFSYCSNLTSLDLSNFNTDNVTIMAYMFSNCSNLTSLDLSNFNTIYVGSLGGIFEGCLSLHTLRLDNCNNNTISRLLGGYGFPTGTITDSEGNEIPRKIFCKQAGAEGLTAPDGWAFEIIDAEPEIPVYEIDMFRDNREITEVEVIVNDTHTNLNEMFSGCTALTTVNTEDWDTSNVTDMSWMFSDCFSLTALDLSSFDTSKVENMERMFCGCSHLETLDLSGFDTSNVRNMERMFEWCRELRTLDISWFDTSNVENMDCMFEGCNNLETLKLDNCSYDTIARIINDANLPTGLIEDKERKMYVNPNNVEGLTAPEGWVFVDSDGNEIIPEIPVCEYCGEPDCDGSCQDNGEEPETPETPEEPEEPETSETPYIVATFSTNESVNMLGEPSVNWSSSFDNGTTWERNYDNMTKGNEIVYLKPVNTSDIKIYRLFENSSYVTHIEFYNFSAYPVYPYADYMFSNCSNLTELDLSSLNFSNGMNNLEGMFSNCNNLESLNLSNWDLGDDLTVNDMFNSCNSLHTLRLDNCDNFTVEKIITSEGFPTDDIGVTRKIYILPEHAAELSAPENWVFYNCETDEEIVPDKDGE